MVFCSEVFSSAPVMDKEGIHKDDQATEEEMKARDLEQGTSLEKEGLSPSVLQKDEESSGEKQPETSGEKQPEGTEATEAPMTEQPGEQGGDSVQQPSSDATR